MGYREKNFIADTFGFFIVSFYRVTKTTQIFIIETLFGGLTKVDWGKYAAGTFEKKRSWVAQISNTGFLAASIKEIIKQRVSYKLIAKCLSLCLKARRKQAKFLEGACFSFESQLLWSRYSLLEIQIQRTVGFVPIFFAKTRKGFCCYNSVNKRRLFGK